MNLEYNIKVLNDMDKGLNKRQNIHLNLVKIQQLNLVIRERYCSSLKSNTHKPTIYDNSDHQLLFARLVHRLQMMIPVSQTHLQLLQDNDLIIFDNELNLDYQK